MVRRRSIRGLIAAALMVLATGAAALPATAAPAPITTPGGLRPDQVMATAAGCISDGTNVCIVKSTSMPSCSGYTSQTTPPATIRVLVHGTPNTVVTVDFRTYVKNALPNEWVPSWAPEALKAGAVAVKSYAWFWVTHYGGYLKTGTTTTTCFDVTDDTAFQVYRPGSALPSTSTAVDDSWAIAARANGRVLQAGYRAYFNSSGEACGTGAGGSSMSQWGSQNCARAGYNYIKILEKYYFPGLQLVSARQLRTPNDFLFAARTTRALFDPDTGNWAFDDANQTVRHYGTVGDLPAVANTGDGIATMGVFRPTTGVWYIAGPDGRSTTVQQWGADGDIPVQAHYNGISRPTVLATFRPGTSTWYVRGAGAQVFGQPGDIPVPGHYAATASTTDYADVPALFRPTDGDWYLGDGSHVHFGTDGDIPTPGDYNGDGTTDRAVYRPSNHHWYVQGSPGVAFGTDGDIPVTGDYNGDGSVDIALYRPSNQRWYVLGSDPVTFGSVPTAVPVGAAPYRD